MAEADDRSSCSSQLMESLNSSSVRIDKSKSVNKKCYALPGPPITMLIETCELLIAALKKLCESKHARDKRNREKYAQMSESSESLSTSYRRCEFA